MLLSTKVSSTYAYNLRELSRAKEGYFKYDLTVTVYLELYFPRLNSRWIKHLYSGLPKVSDCYFRANANHECKMTYSVFTSFH